MKFVAIWMTANRVWDRCVVNENISNFIAPHFDQTEGNYHHPTLRNPAGDRLDDLTPMNRFFEAGQLQRRVGMRIIENTISDINDALAREFLGRIQRPAQLVVNRERAVFVREA